jgi:hypothetical protein
VGENENAESAIRRFRKAVMSSGHIQEVRELARDDDDATRRRDDDDDAGLGENRVIVIIRGGGSRPKTVVGRDEMRRTHRLTERYFFVCRADPPP